MTNSICDYNTSAFYLTRMLVKGVKLPIVAWNTPITREICPAVTNIVKRIVSIVISIFSLILLVPAIGVGFAGNVLCCGRQKSSAKTSKTFEDILPPSSDYVPSPLAPLPRTHRDLGEVRRKEFSETTDITLMIDDLKLLYSQPLSPRVFYPSRISFFNPSRNCSYNSFAVVTAHSGRSLKERFEKMGYMNVDPEKIKQAKITLEGIIKEGTDEVVNLERKIGLLDVEMQPILDKIKSKVKSERIDETDYSDSMMNVLNRQRENRLQKIEKEKRPLEHQLQEVKEKIWRAELQLRKNDALEIQNIWKAERTLRTLRFGFSSGDKRMIDAGEANNVARLFTQDREEPLGWVLSPLYKGAVECEDDKGRLRLINQIRDPNWRAIQIGGHDHFWAMIRNEGSDSVDILDDFSNLRGKMSFNEMIKRWSIPETWKKEQLAFI